MNLAMIIQTPERRPQPAIPRGPAADPDHQAAADRLALIAATIVEKERKRTALEIRVFEAASHAAVKDGADALTSALAVANGGRLPPADSDLRAQIAELSREIDTLKKGAAEQRTVLEAVNRRLSRAHCAAQRPKLVAIAKRKLTALSELDAADNADAALRREIADAGFDASALPSLSTGIGRSDDATGSPAYWAAADLRAFLGNH
jgi:hypothetical protein